MCHVTEFFFLRCNDPKKISLAEATVNSVEKLTADLQDTARVVSEMASRENRTLEQSLAYMGVVERMNLLQREWATKVIEVATCTPPTRPVCKFFCVESNFCST